MHDELIFCSTKEIKDPLLNDLRSFMVSPISVPEVHVLLRLGQLLELGVTRHHAVEALLQQNKRAMTKDTSFRVIFV